MNATAPVLPLFCSSAFFFISLFFSRFLSFFLPRNPISLFFLTTGSSDPSPFPRPAIAVNLSVHARIRRGQIESGKFESVTSKLLRLKGYKLAIGKLTSMSRFTGNIPNYSRIYSQVNICSIYSDIKVYNFKGKQINI